MNRILFTAAAVGLSQAAAGKPLRRALRLVFLAVVFGGPHDLPAQGAGSPGTRLLVIRYSLKPDHVAQWLELQKTAVLPALRAAGVKHQVVYETVLGDAPFHGKPTRGLFPRPRRGSGSVRQQVPGVAR
ncbi:MAG: hypothetical protein WA825_12115 [Steroidobacteraceae bacterium]